MCCENVEFLIIISKRQHVLIKSGVMNEWICIPHDGKVKKYNVIQHTAHNNQFNTQHIITNSTHST
jgi:hypothetical protein